MALSFFLHFVGFTLCTPLQVYIVPLHHSYTWGCVRSSLEGRTLQLKRDQKIASEVDMCAYKRQPVSEVSVCSLLGIH